MKKEKKLIKRLFLAVFILVFILFVLIAIDFDFVNSFKKTFRREESFSIKDSCGVIMNQLIHDINDEGNCKIRCQNECPLRQESFVKVEFAQNTNSCNDCTCYCR